MRFIKSAVLGAFVIAFLAGCGSENSASAPAQPPLPVGTITAKKADIPIILSYSGTTESGSDVVLKAKVSGAIEKQLFTAGSTIKRGEALYQIDRSKYEAAHNSAQATLKNAQAQLKRAEQLKELNAISPAEYDSVLASFQVAEANSKNTKIDLGFSTVSAPFDGVIGDTKKDIGSFVSVSEELVRLTSLNPIFVRFAISDVARLNISQNIKSGQWIEQSASAFIEYEGRKIEGKLSFVDNIIDAASGTVDAKAEFENSDLSIRPGAFVRISVGGFMQKDGFQIPQIAMLQDLVSPFVYVVKDGKVAKAPIKIASQDATTAVVSHGLSDGDVVIVDNFLKIKIGQPVSPVPAGTTFEQIQQMQKAAQSGDGDGVKAKKAD